MHRFVNEPERSWTTGALFEHENTQLLAEVTTRGDEIVLRTRGPERKALLSVIASDLDALNDSFAGLKDRVGKCIPCTCSRCVCATSPEFFEERRLRQRRRDNKLTIECPTSYEDVSVLELLDGLKLDQRPPWADTTGKTIKIFLASSEELRLDRDAFDLYLRQHNDRLRRQGLYLKVIRWENFLDAMSETRLQDEYNREVRNCDIFVSLFMTKTGRYTEEEFDVAHKAFTQKGKPLIYTFFKDVEVSIVAVKKDDLESLWRFQEKLKKLGHFHTQYKSTEDLQLRFKDQLEKLLEQGKL